jgi:5-methylcytosine-specific restriction enzyme subunit McrC
VSGITIFEFDTLVSDASSVGVEDGVHCIPQTVYAWLEAECLRAAEDGEAAWLRMTQKRGRRALNVTSYVGVIRAPNGYQIEVLPKVGKAIGGRAVEARQLLIEMLCCLERFRHIQTASAKISAARMPLLEVFIAEFLHAVDRVIKRGMRGNYAVIRENVYAMRGRLLFSQQLRHNLCRADRFFTERDEFSTDRPENRLLHAALRRVLAVTASQPNQKLGRELQFVLANVPTSTQPRVDFQKVNLGRGMDYYADALAWARLILEEESPVTGEGGHSAPSLLFPMEALFEAFVSKHLAKQIKRPLTLKSQAKSRHLVRHLAQNWFWLKPDFLIRDGADDVLVLDAKWKLLDGLKANGKDKYGLSQSDFYQLQAYGQNYLDGCGDVVLIYPKTSAFDAPLPVFEFPKSAQLRLWVLPFCLRSRRLHLPDGGLALRGGKTLTG